MKNLKEWAEAADAALLVAAQHQISISITVVDFGGHRIFTYRQPQASYVADEASCRKARTAGAFAMPTHVLAGAASALPDLKAHLPADAFLLPGGLPLLEQGSCIGGLGISGGNSEQDMACAQAFVAALAA